MKKLVALMLACLMVLSLAACGSPDDDRTPDRASDVREPVSSSDSSAGDVGKGVGTPDEQDEPAVDDKVQEAYAKLLELNSVLDVTSAVVEFKANVTPDESMSPDEYERCYEYSFDPDYKVYMHKYDAYRPENVVWYKEYQDEAVVVKCADDTKLGYDGETWVPAEVPEKYATFLTWLTLPVPAVIDNPSMPGGGLICTSHGTADVELFKDWFNFILPEYDVSAASEVACKVDYDSDTKNLRGITLSTKIDDVEYSVSYYSYYIDMTEALLELTKTQRAAYDAVVGG